MAKKPKKTLKFKPLTRGRKFLLAVLAVMILFGGMWASNSIYLLRVKAEGAPEGVAMTGGHKDRSYLLQGEDYPTGNFNSSIKIENHPYRFGESRRKGDYTGAIQEYRVTVVVPKPEGKTIIYDMTNKNQDFNPYIVGIGPNQLWTNPKDENNQIYDITPFSDADNGQGGGYSISARFQKSWLQGLAESGRDIPIKITYYVYDPNTDQATPKTDKFYVSGEALTTKSINEIAEGHDVTAVTDPNIKGSSVEGTPQDVNSVDKRSDAADKCSEKYKGFGLNTIKSILCQWFIEMANFIQEKTQENVKKMLDWISEFVKNKGADLDSWVKKGWNLSRSLVDIFAVIVLIIAAFANILHINLNIYAVKRVLPTLIGAIIFANLSFFIIKSCSTIIYNLTDNITEIAAAGIGEMARSVVTLITASVLSLMGIEGVLAAAAIAAALATEGILIIIVVLILVIALVVLILFLFFLFYIQPGIVGILTIFAPVAIIAMAFPATQGVFKKWLGFIAGWLLMVPLCFLIFAAMNIVKLPDATLIKDSGIYMSMFALAGQVLLLIFAVRIPFTLSGDIGKGWSAAGKWVGGQINSRYYAGAMGARSERANLNKQMEAAGIDTKNKKDVFNYLRKRKDLKGMGRYYYGGRLSGAALATNPRTYISGYKRQGERREAMTKGLEAAFNPQFARIAGKGESFAVDRDSQAGKAQLLSDMALLKAFGNLQDKKTGNKEFELSPQQKLSAILESPGAFEGHVNSGAIWNNVPQGKVANAWAIIREMFRRSNMTAYGEVLSPDIVEKMVDEKLTHNMSDFVLALANMGPEQEKLISDDQLEKAVLQRLDIKPDDTSKEALNRFQRHMTLIRGMQRRSQGKMRSAEGATGVPEQASGPEIAPSETVGIVGPELENKEKADEEVMRGVRGQLEISDDDLRKAEAGRAQEVVVANTPIDIKQQEDLRVVDIGVRQSLDDQLGRINTTIKKQTDEASGAAAVSSADTHLTTPSSVDDIVKSGRYPDPASTKLSPRVERMMYKFILAASKGEGITKSTAANYYRRNLTDLMPYVGNIASAYKEGKLQPESLGTMTTRIDTGLKKLQSGEGLSDDELNTYRQDLGKLSPGIAISPDKPARDLAQVGNKIRDALELVNKPDVVDEIRRDASPQNVQGAVIGSEASRLIRQTSIGQMESVIRKIPPAGAGANAQRSIELQVSSYIKNSPSFKQVLTLPSAQQKQVVLDVSKQISKPGVQLNQDKMDTLISGVISGAKRFVTDVGVVEPGVTLNKNVPPSLP